MNKTLLCVPCLWGLSLGISGTDAALASQAAKVVEDIARDLKVGDVYTGKVVRIVSSGAIVEVMPGKDGMIHISQLARERVERVEDVVSLGDEVQVKVIEVEPGGKVRFSRKELLGGPSEGQPSGGQRREAPPSREGGGRRGPRGRR